MNNEITQHAKDLLDKGAERNKKHLEQMRKEEEKPLRDHFAGLAMQGIISAQIEMRSIGNSYTAEGSKYLAEESYLIADAMLRARLITEDKEVYGE